MRIVVLFKSRMKNEKRGKMKFLCLCRRASPWTLLPPGHGRSRTFAATPPRPVVWSSWTPAHGPASAGRLGRPGADVDDGCCGSSPQHGPVPLVWLAKLGCRVSVIVVAMCRCHVHRRCQLSCRSASSSCRSCCLATESVYRAFLLPAKFVCSVCRRTSHSACSLRCGVRDDGYSSIGQLLSALSSFMNLHHHHHHNHTASAASVS